MKIILTIIMFGSFILSNAQDKLTFAYDPLTGNQTKRTLCINCTSNKSTKDVKEIEAITNEDLLKFSPEDVISYYPNPVKEELYIKWELIDENFVSSIQVIGINGQILQSYANKRETNTQNIPFQNYPSGVYIVSLSYYNGEQKTLKIIKQ